MDVFCYPNSELSGALIAGLRANLYKGTRILVAGTHLYKTGITNYSTRFAGV